jgi:hypothetical protein
MPTGADVRAERLRVALAVLDVPRDVEPREFPPPLSAAEVTLANQVDDDMALVDACLEVERELRECGYAALERLSAEVAGRQGDLDERIVALPDSEVRCALVSVYESQWCYGDPQQLSDDPPRAWPRSEL